MLEGLVVLGGVLVSGILAFLFLITCRYSKEEDAEKVDLLEYMRFYIGAIVIVFIALGVALFCFAGGL